MTLLDLYKKAKRISGYFNSADIPLKYNGKDFNIDFEFESKDAIVSHIEVKQDPVLTWGDVKTIFKIADNYESEPNRPKYLTQGYCQEILNRFNKQRQK